MPKTKNQTKEEYTTAKVQKDLHRAISVEAAKQQKDKQELMNAVIRAGMQSMKIPLSVRAGSITCTM